MTANKSLIEGNGSFWKEVAPLLPNYVKITNQTLTRLDPPLETLSSPQRNFIVNEMAFSVVASNLWGKNDEFLAEYDNIQKTWSRRLPSNDIIDLPLSVAESKDIEKISTRLNQYLFIIGARNPTYRKIIAGVGRIEYVEVDAITNTHIVEVKSGQRNLRSIDFRQLLLSLIAIGPTSINLNCSIINPREGIVWQSSSKDFVESVSLMGFNEMISTAIYHFSEAGISA